MIEHRLADRIRLAVHQVHDPVRQRRVGEDVLTIFIAVIGVYSDGRSTIVQPAASAAAAARATF